MSEVEQIRSNRKNMEKKFIISEGRKEKKQNMKMKKRWRKNERWVKLIRSKGKGKENHERK